MGANGFTGALWRRTTAVEAISSIALRMMANEAR
jgi:hypothetical protein